jgi:hypothetical protein
MNPALMRLGHFEEKGARVIKAVNAGPIELGATGAVLSATTIE